MTGIWHAIVFGSYTLAALVLMAALPGILYDVPPGVPTVIGLFVFVAGAVGHEALTRRASEQQATRRYQILRKAYNQNRDDLQRTRDEIRRVYEAMETLQGADAAVNMPEMHEVATEVKVLHGLVEQLYSATPSPPTMPLLGLGQEFREEFHEEPTEDGRMEPRIGPEAPGAKPDSMLGKVRDALRQNRVELYLQPIVSLPQRKRRYFECFSRVHGGDGTVILPAQYLEAARQANLLAAIDNMMTFRCVQLVRKVQEHDYSTAFFCNVSANSFADRRFFHDFIGFLESCEELAPSMVFEFAQADLAMHGDEATRDLARLHRVGYRFCIDQVKDLRMDADRLVAQGFRFVKVDAGLLLRRAQEDPVANGFRQLKQKFDKVGIDLIIEKIETEQMLAELLDFNIDYGQGYLFGEPRVSKESALPRGYREAANA